jgi:hypothetical protein
MRAMLVRVLELPAQQVMDRNSQKSVPRYSSHLLSLYILT